MAEAHNLDEAVFREPAAPLDHVIKHHRDLRDGSADVDKAEQQKVEKDFAPRKRAFIC